MTLGKGRLIGLQRRLTKQGKMRRAARLTRRAELRALSGSPPANQQQ